MARAPRTSPRLYRLPTAAPARIAPSHSVPCSRRIRTKKTIAPDHRPPRNPHLIPPNHPNTQQPNTPTPQHPNTPTPQPHLANCTHRRPRGIFHLALSQSSPPPPTALLRAAAASSTRRRLATDVAVTIAELLTPTASQNVAALLVPPVVDAASLSAQLSIDASQLTVGAPSVTGVAATVSVEVQGEPT